MNAGVVADWVVPILPLPRSGGGHLLCASSTPRFYGTSPLYACNLPTTLDVQGPHRYLELKVFPIMTINFWLNGKPQPIGVAQCIHLSFFFVCH
jgi:hypothetical protein